MSGKLSNSPVRSAEASRLPQANSRNRYPNALPDLHWDAVQRSDFTGDRCETRCTLELQVGKWPGIDFSIAREDISSETDWKILDNRHTVVVHLNGPIHKLETELDGSGELTNRRCLENYGLSLRSADTLAVRVAQLCILRRSIYSQSSWTNFSGNTLTLRRSGLELATTINFFITAFSVSLA